MKCCVMRWRAEGAAAQQAARPAGPARPSQPTCMRASKLVMSRPWMWISSGTGRTPGAKLKRPWLLAPSHSPRSLALARLCESATMRMGLSCLRGVAGLQVRGRFGDQTNACCRAQRESTGRQAG
jgi:hypothetical protein